MQTITRAYKGTLTNGVVTLYTVATGKKFIVTEVVLANIAGTDATCTITFAGTDVIKTYTVPANKTIVIKMNTVILGDEIIQGTASANTSINAYISGVEV